MQPKGLKLFYKSEILRGTDFGFPIRKDFSVKKKIYKVTGMTCAACSARVEGAVSKLCGKDKCEVNLLLGTLTVSADIPSEKIIKAVEGAGYGIQAENKEENKTRPYGEGEIISDGGSSVWDFAVRLIISATLLIFLMYISMGHGMFGFPLPAFFEENPLAIGLTQAVISAAVLLVNKHFFINGARGIVRLAPNMDTLVSLGAGASFIYSLCLLFIMSEEINSGNTAAAHSILHGLYFEAAAMIPVLISIGKLLESGAKSKTTAAIRELIMLTPREASVEREDAEIRIATSDIKEGDTVIVRQGESISCDGEIIFGGGSIDESMLTGESIPADKSLGGNVFSGTVLLSGFLKIRADKVGEETAISEIVRMVKEASGSKAPVAKAADKISGVFVPFVLIAAAITLAVWLIMGETVGFALARAVSVLVVSCPCALGLATPVAVMVGSGVGAKRGILYKNAAALEYSGRVKKIFLDKTGTVTEGKPRVEKIYPFGVCEEDFARKIYAAEFMSEHPLARAAVSYAVEKLGEQATVQIKDKTSEFTASGGGVSVLYDKTYLSCGNLAFTEEKIGKQIPKEIKLVAEKASDKGLTPLFLSEKEKLLGVISIGDRIKPDSKEAVARLKGLGIKVAMLTGDNQRCAAAIAEAVGIEEYKAEIFPADKANFIKECSEKERCCMVGDGINDAPALASATVGMAIGSGSHIACETADIVLRSGSLVSALDAIRLGRRTLLGIYLNLFWAFCYNIVGIPLAAGVFTSVLGWTLNPMFGALAMSLSSFLVVTSSLSINLFSPTRVFQGSPKNNVNQSLNSEREKFFADDIKNKGGNSMNNTVVIKIEGMMCPHCSGRVKAVLEKLDCVYSAEVSHEKGEAKIEFIGDYDIEKIKAAITEAGYKAL